MLPSDVEHYLSEIARVLRKNGRCLVTFFLLNAESLQLTKSGAGSLKGKIRVIVRVTFDRIAPSGFQVRPFSH